jgi:hypothetical protein
MAVVGAGDAGGRRALQNPALGLLSRAGDLGEGAAARGSAPGRWGASAHLAAKPRAGLTPAANFSPPSVSSWHARALRAGTGDGPMEASFFVAGGYGMYPTTVFGALLVAAGIAYALFPERRFVPLLISLGVAVFGSGALGTVAGFITTFQAIQKLPADSQHAVTLMGISESLNNAAWAFVFIVLATLIASAGALRLALKSKATPANPG